MQLLRVLREILVEVTHQIRRYGKRVNSSKQGNKSESLLRLRAYLVEASHEDPQPMTGSGSTHGGLLPLS